MAEGKKITDMINCFVYHTLRKLKVLAFCLNAILRQSICISFVFLRIVTRLNVISFFFLDGESASNFLSKLNISPKSDKSSSNLKGINKVGYLTFFV